MLMKIFSIYISIIVVLICVPCLFGQNQLESARDRQYVSSDTQAVEHANWALIQAGFPSNSLTLLCVADRGEFYQVAYTNETRKAIFEYDEIHVKIFKDKAKVDVICGPPPDIIR